MQLKRRISQLAKQTIPWLLEKGPESDVVVSTRMRLARNISGHPFPKQANSETRLRIFEFASKAIEGLPDRTNSIAAELTMLPTIDRQVLFERHLISREQTNPSEGSGVFISASESSTILVNEEDHLRLQIIKPGLLLSETWSEIDQLDNFLSERMTFSFKTGLGFLTSCPTNVGTGLRASAMVHLPALVFNSEIKSVIRALEQTNFAVRGLYGEGSESLGNFYQISNQSTLGEDEITIVNKLGKIIKRVVDLEKNARKFLLQRKQMELCDQIGRSLGLLSHGYLLSTREALTKLSFLRLGVDLGMFSTLNANTINTLIVMIQSGHIQKQSRKKLTTQERDLSRARIVKTALKNSTS